MPYDYRVSGTVNVEFAPYEISLIKMGFPLQLQCNIWADDTSPLALTDGPSPSDYGSSDDFLFSFTAQNITAPGTYAFNAIVPRWLLNEDNSWAGERDEAYNRFSLVSGSNLFPSNNIVINSPTLTGVVGY
jgi:hypothetical protein